MGGYVWTPEEIERLKELVEMGYSLKECKDVFLERSESAMEGVLKRLGVKYTEKRKPKFNEELYLEMVNGSRRNKNR